MRAGKPALSFFKAGQQPGGRHPPWPVLQPNENGLPSGEAVSRFQFRGAEAGGRQDFIFT